MYSHSQGRNDSPVNQQQSETNPQGQSGNQGIDPLEAEAQETFDSIIQTQGHTRVMNLVKFLKEEERGEFFGAIKEVTGRDYKDVDDVAKTLAEGAKASSTLGNVRKNINEDPSLGVQIQDNGSILKTGAGNNTNTAQAQQDQSQGTGLASQTQPQTQDMAITLAEEAYLNSIPNLEYVKSELEEKSILTGKSVATLYRENQEVFSQIAQKRADAEKDDATLASNSGDVTNQNTPSQQQSPDEERKQRTNKFEKLGQEIANSSIHPDNIRL